VKRQNEFSRRLEGIPSVLFWVCVGHLLVAALIVFWVAPFMSEDGGTSLGGGDSPTALNRQWHHPSRFVKSSPIIGQAAAEADAEQPLLVPGAPTPDVEAEARYITLFRRAPMDAKVVGDGVSDHDATLLDEALDRMDKGLYEVFMSVWNPPSSRLVAPSKRVARLDVTLNRQAQVEGFQLAVPSGSPELDLSVVEALEAATRLIPEIQGGKHSLQFPQSLPSNFPDQRYECRIQFQIE